MADPHRARARQILRRHPHVRQLMGRNPYTALIAVALIALQLAAAWAVHAWSLPWWGAVLAAALVGAHLVHALYAVIHEAAHRLVFASRRSWAALWWRFIIDSKVTVASRVARPASEQVSGEADESFPEARPVSGESYNDRLTSARDVVSPSVSEIRTG